jgi:hypothetical protein
VKLAQIFALAAMLAAIVLVGPSANAQTMGEYATTTGVASGGAGSISSTVQPSIGGDSFDRSPELGGGTRTWGTSALGASFSERASAISAGSSMGDFSSRASALSASGSGERFHIDRSFGGEGRFGTGDRFSGQERFGDTGRFPNSDRFSKSSFNDDKGMGLDTTFNSASGN